MISLSINVPIILLIQSILSMMSKNYETFPETESDIFKFLVLPDQQFKKILIIRQREAVKYNQKYDQNNDLIIKIVSG